MFGSKNKGEESLEKKVEELKGELDEAKEQINELQAELNNARNIGDKLANAIIGHFSLQEAMGSYIDDLENDSDKARVRNLFESFYGVTISLNRDD